MTLYQVSTGQTVNASDINQLVSTLQQQPGGQELGTYYLTGVSPAGGITGLGAWCPSQSRGSSPVSVSINTSIQSPVNLLTPTTDHLSSYGFHVFAGYTAGNTAANVGGTFTIQY
jgi:hypothetical protein